MIARVLLGVICGLVVTILILVAARWVLFALDGKTFALEHGAIQVVLVLGAGFGAIVAAILVRRDDSVK